MKYDDNFLNLQRQQGDPHSDAFIRSMFSQGRAREVYGVISLPIDKYEGVEGIAESLEFINDKRPHPLWYSEQRIINGQNFFKNYASEIMTLLGVLALPYCYAGSPGNKALYLSDKMRNNPGKRLLDTGEFVLGVSTPGSLTKDEYGYLHINKTRLIHSIARYYLLKNGWDMDWGLPINQEDMAGTNLAFSYIILNGLDQLGFSISEREKEDFIYLWRYIGYQMHIDEQLLPNSYREAFILKQKIQKRNFATSTEGIELTRELLNYYHSVAPKGQERFIESQVRYYLGNRISEYLGLGESYMKDRFIEVLNSFSQLQNNFSNHKNSYGEMLRNFNKLKAKANLNS